MTTLDNTSKLQDGVGDAFENLTVKQLAGKLNDDFQAVVLPVTIFVGLEAVLGLFGNLIVLCVFSFRYHVCNFRYFVLCLASIDILSSLTTMPGEMVTQLHWYVYPDSEVCKVKSFFNMFTVSAEALCLLAIAFDRYRKVCQPFKWQIKPRAARYICGIIYFISLILSLPVPFFWGLHSHQRAYKNVVITVTICEKDEQFKDTKYPLIYSVTMEAVMSVCLLVMLGLYISIAKKLVKEKRKQKRASYPKIVISPPQDTDSTSCVNTCAQSDVGDTSFTSGFFNDKVTTQGIKDDGITSGDETDAQVMSTTLTAPCASSNNQASNNNGRKLNTRDSPLRRRDKMSISTRVRSKTLIMCILTVIFIATTILYMTLLSFIARSNNSLQDMSHAGKAAYFFFFRLYFLNHILNPVIYGLLDPKFRKVMRNSCSKR